MKYFARHPIICKHQTSAQKKILLVGGFNGYLNLGDVVQLQGAIQTHRRLHPDWCLIPVIHPSALRRGLDLDILEKLFPVDDWLYYIHENEDHKWISSLDRLDLHVVNMEAASLPAWIHFYGSGRLNRFWGQRTLSLLDDLLSAVDRKGYLISGQQVSPEFAPQTAIHIRKHKPVLVGCRDQESIEYLEDENLPASYSGDDALDIFLQVSKCLGETNTIGEEFGLNYRRAVFTGNPAHTNLPHSEIEYGLSQLREMISQNNFHNKTLILESYGFAHQQGVSVEVVPELDDWYPGSENINLVDEMYRERWLDVSVRLARLQSAVVMSYHLAMFLYCLDVPTHLLGMNEFYRQKQRSLGQEHIPIEKYFRSGERDQILSHQRSWLRTENSKRDQWIQDLSSYE